MKTKEELNALKEEVETVKKKFTELTDDELEKVIGGSGDPVVIACFICAYPCRIDPNTCKYSKDFPDRCIASREPIPTIPTIEWPKK